MIDAQKLAAEIERANIAYPGVDLDSYRWVEGYIAALKWVREQGVPVDDGTAEIVRDLMKRGQWT